MFLALAYFFFGAGFIWFAEKHFVFLGPYNCYLAKTMGYLLMVAGIFQYTLWTHTDFFSLIEQIKKR